MQVPLISVGILSGKEIEFSFPIKFISSDETESSGMQKAIYRDGKIHWQGKEYNELSFTPQQGAPAFFELKDVTIGINFHWERKEVQKFKGELKIIVEGGTTYCYQYYFHRRISHQCDFIRNECYCFFRTTKGTCCYFPKLAVE